MICLETAVGIPHARAATAMLDLNEPHAPFHHPPRRQERHAKVLGMRLIDTVQPLRLLRFLRKVHDIRHALLHPKSQFVGSNPGRRRRVVGILDAREAVEPLHESKTFRLSCRRKRPLWLAESQRIGRIDSQRHGVVSRPEIDTVLLVPILPFAYRDELRQIVVERSQTVVHPRSERGELAVKRVTASVKLGLGHVVAVSGPHRPHD